MRRLFAWLRELVRPTLPEPIETSQWVRVRRLALWISPILAAMNALPYLVPSMLFDGISHDAYGTFLVMNIPAHAVIVTINVLSLRYQRTERMRRLNVYATVVLLNWTSATGLYIGTHVLIAMLMMVSIAFFRVVFDGRIGLFALVTAAAMVIAFAVAQTSGWIHLPPILSMPEGTRPGALIATSTMWFVGLLGIAWVMASHVANRFRAGDHALVIERSMARRNIARTLAQAGQGRLTGSEVAGYLCAELLGRGGMGEVYAAKDEAGNEVALKVLHPHLLEDDEMLARFRREAEAARRLSTVYVPEVLDVGMTIDGSAYIAMERLRGEDLAAHLRRRGRLPVDEVVRLVAEIAKALDAAHAAEVVHRDLKPQNVFLVGNSDTKTPEIRLLDFGIARLLDAVGVATLTHGGALLGSPGYMAPEQARGATGEIGPASDVFALGAIAYRALTGTEAFPARTTAAAVYEALSHNPQPPSQRRPGLPEQVDAVIALAIAKSSKSRYGAAGEFAADLERAVRGTLAASTVERAASLPSGDIGNTVTLAASTTEPQM